MNKLDLNAKQCPASAMNEQNHKVGDILIQKVTENESICEKIVSKLTTEKPLGYVFTYSDIKEPKSGGGVAGTIIGGAMGGISGAMMGSAVGSTFDLPKHSGKFGILVVTQTHIFVKCIESYFSSVNGKISYEQLSDLLACLNSVKPVKGKVFEISDSVILDQQKLHGTGIEIRSGNDVYSFDGICSYMDGTMNLMLASVKDLLSLLDKLGGVPANDIVIEKLLRKVNPINESQLEITLKDNIYYKRLLHRILNHKERDLIFENFSYLLPSARSILEKKILEKAGSYHLFLWLERISGMLFLAVLIFALFHLPESIYYSIPVLLILIILIFVFDDISNDAHWCREKKHQYIKPSRSKMSKDINRLNKSSVTPNDFREVMSIKSDDELISIVKIMRNDYQEEAVKAAEDEIEKRNLKI